MQIDPTLVLLQMIPFLLAVFGLWFIIFKPTLKVLEAREQAIVGSRDRAQRLQAQVQAKVSEFEARLQEASTTAAAERARLRKETAARESEIREQARAEAERITAEARAQIRQQADEGRALLAREADAMSREIVKVVLGREVRP